MYALHRAVSFQRVEVRPGCDAGDTEGLAEFADPHEAALVDESVDLLSPDRPGQRVAVRRRCRGAGACRRRCGGRLSRSHASIFA
jgi:hypothetical protein